MPFSLSFSLSAPSLALDFQHLDAVLICLAISPSSPRPWAPNDLSQFFRRVKRTRRRIAGNLLFPENQRDSAIITPIKSKFFRSLFHPILFVTLFHLSSFFIQKFFEFEYIKFQGWKFCSLLRCSGFFSSRICTVAYILFVSDVVVEIFGGLKFATLFFENWNLARILSE